MRPCHLVLFLVVSCTGCTTLALERETIRQSGSLSDLRYKEALNVLAALSENRWTLPAYCSIYAGTTKLSDTESTSAVTVVGRELLKVGSITHFQAETADAMVSRSVIDNWTLDPVTSPEKLAAMRAACWWILDGERCLPPEARAILEKGPDDLADRTPGYHFDVAESLGKIPTGWLHVGKFAEVPLAACYRGHCHGTWVWVMPEGRAGLAAFTLVMQDLARVNTDAMYFPKPITRTLTITQQRDSKSEKVEVTVYVAPDGKLASGDKQHTELVKLRQENLATDSTLKSQIAVSQSK